MTKLELVRRLRGLTLRELGAVSGTSYSDISKAERGFPIYPRARQKLAQALGVNEADLFDPTGVARKVDPVAVLTAALDRRTA